MVHHRNGVGRNSNVHQLQCSKYRVNDALKEDSFTPDKYRQEGTKVETTTNYKSTNKKEHAFPCMNHHKLRERQKKNITDCRSQKVTKRPPKMGPIHEHRRTQSFQANSAKSRCHTNLMFSMNITTGYWFLHSPL